MRLADFIGAHIEAILAEWETFARSISPGEKMDKLALRNHVQDILHATVLDMASAQDAAQQADKSMGHDPGGEECRRLNGASDQHAIGRVTSGFDMIEVVAEYRALRASVIRLWRKSNPHPDGGDIDDLTRFNESIDQSLTKAVSSFTKRVDHSREMFLAILGHDLRNPLNSIAMSADLLLQTGDLHGEPSELAGQISTSAAVMAGMIGDLLDYTRTRLGADMPVSFAPMDLANLCRDVYNEFKAASPTRTLRLQSEGDLTGEWDVVRLRQVVSNLLVNAIQHGAEGGPVEVSVRAQDSDVVLRVHNQGLPIPPELLPTIFDPLVRGAASESPRQRRPGSIGLGLYIVRQIVMAHGGTIDVQSSEEAGTSFTIRLPRHHPVTNPITTC